MRLGSKVSILSNQGKYPQDSITRRVEWDAEDFHFIFIDQK